jgi:UDP-N-acetylmuramyl pentapeptide phosphotransferase/UDP-N-acetylglucosamine-1-phosphate transferase
MWIAIPLTIVASVGIINAINLIDGVNGLSTGFCIMASSLFAIYFYNSNNLPMCVIAVSAAGAIIPFFLHNVFGQSSKMFIGDGGTLTMGIVLSTFVVHTLSDASNAPISLDPSFGLVPFSLAVLAIPVFDTLRVMLARIMRGTSPFHPDKTHLHHLFIEMRFSHAGASVSIIFLNAMVIAAQLLTWKLGGSINMQMLVVVVISLLCTTGLYYTMQHISEKNILKRAMYRIGLATRFERKGVFSMLQHLVDKL